MNSMENINSLSILVIDTFPGLLHLSGKLLKNNKCLTYLEIQSCQNLHSLPSELEKLTALKSLIISNCEELSCLPLGLQNLKVLELLEINGCHGMVSLPEDGIGGLSSLQNLFIESCHNLFSLSRGLCRLTALEQLSIMSCPKLASLPDGLQNLSALRSLTVISCPELFSLPEGLQHVTTLQSLMGYNASVLSSTCQFKIALFLNACASRKKLPSFIILGCLKIEVIFSGRPSPIIQDAIYIPAASILEVPDL
ncbi:hypothetical protein F0562_020849 [Nyssa sinensis]|uniref:Disease resistance R13L4/SHOC-2-like LRR domain-containing protein n=1 Tax=Nyssa sinensis TaxID=561372 RepID=A0A5J5BUE4_9ASTE|nr:hypothetical protein F0562_020849 [Nyssa sinensis]